MARLLLVRHGQSTWNATGRWQGQEDPPLTNLGRLQAAHAAGSIGAVDAIFGSTLERASVTAQIIAESIGVGPVVCLPGLVERHAGEWQGLTRDEIDLEWPGFLDQHRRPPGWEDDETLLARTVPALRDIATSVGNGDAVVVTHGGVIYNVETRLGAPFERIANLGGRWIEVAGEELRLGDRLDLLHGAEITIPDQI